MLVTADGVPQDNLAAAVIVHVGNDRLIQPWHSGVMSTPSPAARRFSGILEYGLLWLLMLCASVLGLGYLAFSTVKF